MVFSSLHLKLFGFLLFGNLTETKQNEFVFSDEQINHLKVLIEIASLNLALEQRSRGTPQPYFLPLYFGFSSAAPRAISIGH